MADNNEDNQQQQLDTTLNSAQILSIPSQQPEPPKHSTPKRPETDWFDRPPTFDISSICGDEFDQKFEINTISSSARKNLLGIERNKSTLNFGYVPIGGSMLLRQKVWNCDSEQMRIKCSILSALKDTNLESDCFKIMDISSPIMQPGEWCEITVKYEPEKIERNVARLAVERENGAHFRYSFTLIGNGGNAQLSLDANFDAGIAFRTTSNQAIIIRPDIFNRFWLTFENRGQRSAFVSLIATNCRGTILSREVGREQQQVSIQPAQFVLDAFDDGKGSKDKHKINVLIRVNETFNWTIGIVNGRDSLLSSASASNSQSADCAFQILAYWGEENQRQRLKCWERAYKPFYKDGFRFTGCFENEQQLNLDQRGKLQENVKEDDAQEFKNTLRIVRMNVVDDRARTYFPSQPDALQPLLNMFKNHHFLLAEVHPEEENVGGSNSTIMPFRNALDL